MTRNGNQGSEKSENGYKKEINGSLYLTTEERNECDKRNREWHERKEQPKMVRTRAKGKKWT